MRYRNRVGGTINKLSFENRHYYFGNLDVL
jgi:hypothetical protein